MRQPLKVLLRAYLETFCQNVARKCFQLNLTLIFYCYVHFKRFSGIKICKICNMLPSLTQNLLQNPSIFLTLFLFSGS